MQGLLDAAQNKVGGGVDPNGRDQSNAQPPPVTGAEWIADGFDGGWHLRESLFRGIAHRQGTTLHFPHHHHRPFPVGVIPRTEVQRLEVYKAVELPTSLLQLPYS